ncbi:MAG: TraR/DksA family transcriptional regulator [Bradymonadaceae bacterium]
MSPEELETLRKLLINRRDELVDEGDLAIEPVRRDSTGKLDDDEAPLAEMNQVIASRRNKNRTLELARIEAALIRLDEDPDGFGECADCEEPIPMGRMRLMPWVQYCVGCQEKRSPARGGRRRHLGDYEL